MARRLVLTVLAAVAAVAFLAVLVSWADSSPVGSGADDDFHLASIWCAAGTTPTGLCSASKVPHHEAGVVMRKVPRDVGVWPCYRPNPHVGAYCLRYASNDLANVRTNDGLYPPYFYRFMHHFIGKDLGASVLRMRWANALLALVMFGAALAVSQGRVRAAGALAWGVGLVPLGMFFIPSTNPSSWSMIGLGTLPIFVLQFLLGSSVPRRVFAGVGAALAYALAVSARTDSPELAAVILGACGIAALMSRGRNVWPLLALPAAGILYSAYRFLTSSASAVVSNGIGNGPAGPHNGPVTHQPEGLQLLWSNIWHIPQLLDGMFGVGWGLGWVENPLPSLVGILATGVVLIVVIRAMVVGDRATRIAFGLTLAALIVVPLLVLQQAGAMVGGQVQPRYMYPLALAAIVIALGAGRAERPLFSPGGYAVVPVVAVVANAYALHATISRYTTGIWHMHLNPGQGRSWWWSGSAFSPLAVWLVGSLAGAVAICWLVGLSKRSVGR